ncbi:MAG TPA: amidohydrolase family protein [Xanthobacteraceae bacterium]|jgi:aminocarboxymuconate-semialdehyde decarboxylase|nr:amidohydrolase family protein [Xanthobacteraceae bacterium]
MTVIDIHAHFVDRHYVDDLIRVMKLDRETTPDGKTLFRDHGATIAWTRPDMFSLEHRLADMAQKGIDKRVLSVSAPNVYPWPVTEQPAITRHINDALAAYCRAQPNKFIGVASLPLSDVDASLRELDRAVHELGLQGVAMGSNIAGLPLNDARFEPLWAKINSLKLPVIEHPVFPRDTSDMGEFELPLRVGLMFDTTLMAARMIYAGIFERYPDFPFVLAHTGAALIMLMERLDNGYRLFPDCRKYIDKLPSEYGKRLYYDSCAFGEKALMFAIDAVGVSQILFGTDDPFIGSDTSHVRRLKIADADKAAILGGNAARLLKV